jgi:hypothetical protein
MDRAALLTLIGDLTNDPNGDRYTTAQRDVELDNSQDKWNIAAKIIRDTVTLTTVSGTRRYALSTLTGTPIAFPRVTHRGLELEKKDKSYFDLYAGDDWTDDSGTPKYFYVDAQDPDDQYLNVFPIPASADAGANLVVEYVKRHTPMTATSDTPFNANTLLTPYHWGLAYDASARLLVRDPNPQNAVKSPSYMKIADNVLTDVIQTFKSLEREESPRLRGGRNWRKY